MITKLGAESIKVVDSTKNQRVERLWRDHMEKVILDFYNLFMFLENETPYLDSSNMVHIWLLHFMFLNLIQYRINAFVSAWNAHAMRTEHGNKSPNQIDILARLAGDIFSVPENIDINHYDFNLYDYDDTIDDGHRVYVNRVPCPLNENEYDYFYNNVVLIYPEDMRNKNILIDKYIDSFLLLSHIIN